MVTIYHNPRCSKSRETLQILLQKLGMQSARQLMRTKEAIYRELGLAEETKSKSELIAALVNHPILIERPIVIHGEQARIDRPPEAVLDIL